MTFKKVSVLVPTRKRLDRLGRFIDSFKSTVRDPDSAELVFRCDKDDLDSVRYLSAYDWTVLVGPRLQGYRSLPSFYNDMAKVATGDVLACGNDDMLFQTRDWPARVLEAANRYPDGIFNLGVNTGLNDDKFPFSIVSRKFNDVLGFINDVRLLFSDIFIRDVMESFSRNVRITNVTFFHDWAGHGVDETRRDANAHEFDMVFADKQGNWTEAYRTRHQSAVAEAVAKITADSDIGPSIVLNNVAQYRPPEPVDSGRRWPPSTSAASWCSGDDRRSLHYHKEEIVRLLRVIFRLPIARGTVVLAPLKSAPSAILWGQVFDKVVAIAEQQQSDPPIFDGKYSIYSGSVGNSRFLYDVIHGISALDCLILDNTQYWSLISPYYLFRGAMRRPGAIIFFRNPDVSAEDDGVARFIRDLRTGAIDGICHELTDIAVPGTPGICYELME